MLFFASGQTEMGKSKTIVPKNSTDRLLFTLMIVGIPFAVLWLGGVVMPHYHGEINSIVVLHTVAALFILYNIFHNMLLVIRTDASGRTSYLPSVLKPGISLYSLLLLIAIIFLPLKA